MQASQKCNNRWHVDAVQSGSPLALQKLTSSSTNRTAGMCLLSSICWMLSGSPVSASVQDASLRGAAHLGASHHTRKTRACVSSHTDCMEAVRMQCLQQPAESKSKCNRSYVIMNGSAPGSAECRQTRVREHIDIQTCPGPHTMWHVSIFLELCKGQLAWIGCPAVVELVSGPSLKGSESGSQVRTRTEAGM